MKKIKRRTSSRLAKKARRGFRGWPLATLAYYGPNDRKATKVVVGVFLKEEDADAQVLERWFSETTDVRADAGVEAEIHSLLTLHGVKQVQIRERLLGCPHESPADYDGDYCPDPACSFWVGRNRWTGEIDN